MIKSTKQIFFTYFYTIKSSIEVVISFSFHNLWDTGTSWVSIAVLHEIEKTVTDSLCNSALLNHPEIAH